MDNPQAYTAALAAEIRAELARQGHRARDLSRSSGIPESSLSGKLKGERGMSAYDLSLIAQFLGVSMQELSHRAEEALSALAGTTDTYTQDDIAAVAHDPGVDIEYEQEETERNQP